MQHISVLLTICKYISVMHPEMVLVTNFIRLIHQALTEKMQNSKNVGANP